MKYFAYRGICHPCPSFCDFCVFNPTDPAYIISGAIIIGGLVSIWQIGLKQGVDFKGGRSYVVRFDKTMNATEVAGNLKDAFGTAPEVKTYGANNQLKITTAFKIDDENQTADDEVQLALYNGLKEYLGDTTYENFKPGFEKAGNGIMSYMKVESTVLTDTYRRKAN